MRTPMCGGATAGLVSAGCAIGEFDLLVRWYTNIQLVVDGVFGAVGVGFLRRGQRWVTGLGTAGAESWLRQDPGFGR